MVYVDNMEAGYKGMIMCHMIADTREELLQMVDKIGVQRKLKNGAKEITMKELAAILDKRKNSCFSNVV